MEHQASALTWILSKSESFGLSIETLSWIREIFPDWSDVHCSFSFNGRQLEGWGAAVSDDLALCKAFAEGMERIVLFQSSFKNSNGLAAHLSREEARINARLELIERDLFLCHFLTKTPFEPIDLVRENWSWLPHVQSWASRHGVEVHFFHLGSIGVVCAITGFKAALPFGYVIGSSANSDLQTAAQSALIESARRTVWFIERAQPTDAISIETFLALPSRSFSDHGRLALSLEYASMLSPLFPCKEVNGSLSFPSRPQLSVDEIQVDDVKWNDSNLADCPFVFARATSQEAQNLWVGPTTPQVINFPRLNQFAGRMLEWSDLNLIPHPFD